MENNYAYSPTKVKTLQFLKKDILVSEMSFNERITSSGIILVGDDTKLSGIRPRWAKIYGVGPDLNDPELKPGKYILISHGRWTRGITVETPEGKVTLRKVDFNDILMVSDDPVIDDTMGDKV